MASPAESWATDAAESLLFWHGDSAVHRAAGTGTETTVTVCMAEITGAVSEDAEAEFVLRTSDVLVERGDYLTYNGRKWRIVLVVVEEDGLYRLEATRAQEVN